MSIFESDAAKLFLELEVRIKTLEQRDSYAAVAISKSLGEAKALLTAGNSSSAAQKYLDTIIQLQKAESSIAAEPLANRLLALEVGYLLLLLLVGYVTHEWPTYWLWVKFLSLHAGAAWFGALGGVAIGLFGLYSHIQARDFDPKYRLWYICKPIVGGIFGWFVFLVFYVGLVAVQSGSGKLNPWLFYATAFLAGFSERFTIKIVDRIMQVLITWEEKPGKDSEAGTGSK
jgi:hypothetical protein